MRKRFRSLIEFILPWYHEYEEHERDTKTARVHERAERAMDEASYLIESYAAADQIMRKHKRRLWRTNGV